MTTIGIETERIEVRLKEAAGIYLVAAKRSGTIVWVTFGIVGYEGRFNHGAVRSSNR